MQAPIAPVLELCDQFAVRHPSLAAALGPSPWLTVSPHDDDYVIGMGVTAALARREGIDVHVAVLTDGALGYVTLEEREGLAARRTLELRKATELLGLDPERLHRFELPDGGLTLTQGCRAELSAASPAQRLVALMRLVRPKVVFVCTPTDVHPDHRVAASELAIATVWASSRIWLELGEPVEPPQVYFYAVYAAFDGSPEFEVRAEPDVFELKLSALRAFESQGVIEPMLDRLRSDGAYEYLRRAPSEPYRPRVYRSQFARAERRL